MMKDNSMTTDDCNKSATALPELLTIEQTAKVLQVSSKTIRRWIDTGDLIAHRLGRQWRISEMDLQTFIRMGRQG